MRVNTIFLDREFFWVLLVFVGFFVDFFKINWFSVLGRGRTDPNRGVKTCRINV